jgi:calcineurin-like phosphoesterase family protein
MKLVHSLESILDSKTSIFLAGPTVRVNNREEALSNLNSWRHEAIKILKQNDFNGTVYIPEFKDNVVPEDFTYSRQVSWEQKALDACKVVLFWIPRDKDKLPGFATNVEFGMFFRSGKIAVGSPENCFKNRYLEELCSQNNIKWNYTLSETIDNALKQITKSFDEKTWLTSDTHFGEIRTMQLSKRPFQSVGEMDWTLILNWNKNVTNNDVVYHLGDFGDPGVLKHLNGKKIYLVLGNYDKNPVVEIITQDPRVEILNEGHEVVLNNSQYSLIHYPENMTDLNKFYLFGHVHKLRTMSKGKNGTGLNVGVDCHNFYPIDLDTVEFYKNAILNHYDNNVFPGEKINVP